MDSHTILARLGDSLAELYSRAEVAHIIIVTAAYPHGPSHQAGTPVYKAISTVSTGNRLSALLLQAQRCWHST